MIGPGSNRLEEFGYCGLDLV